MSERALSPELVIIQRQGLVYRFEFLLQFHHNVPLDQALQPIYFFAQLGYLNQLACLSVSVQRRSLADKNRVCFLLIAI